MIETVRHTLEEYSMLDGCKEVIIGVSGGADSVCLLCVLRELLPQYKVSIRAVHINHNLRDTAGRDEDYVKKLCMEYNIPLRVVSVDVMKCVADTGMSTEEAARSLRYEAFAGEAGDSSLIAVAHNMDDNAETMLLNMCRGTGLRGLAGIPPVRGNIIRPLINVSRREIEAYLAEKGIAYMTDETNLTDDYARNRIRHRVLPYLTEHINSAAVSHINELSECIEGAMSYIDEELNHAKSAAVTYGEGSAAVSLQALSELHPYIRSSLILKVLGDVAGTRKDIGAVHVEKVLSLAELQVGRRISLPYDMEAIRSYDSIRIVSGESDSGLLEAPLEEGLIIDGMKCHIRIFDRENASYQDFSRNTYTKCLDYDRIEGSLVVRGRRDGDYLVYNDAGDRQSLNKYFTNKKVEAHKRDSRPLICDGSHVVWIFGDRISNYYKITEDTKRIMEISFIEKES